MQPGTILMSIGALDEVWVEAEVFERQAALVAVRTPVTMTLDYLPGRRWEGQVDYVYPALAARWTAIALRPGSWRRHPGAPGPAGCCR